MSYRIELDVPAVACTYISSVAAPGKTITVNEDHSALVIDPNGIQSSVPAGDPNFDSPYTWGKVLGDLIVYRSPFPDGRPGKPVVFRMIK